MRASLLAVSLGALAVLGVSTTAHAQNADLALRAPPSGSRVTSRRPLLEWRTAGQTSATVDLCGDRACARVFEHITTVAGERHARAAADLPPGPVFWRVSTAAGTSPTWELFVGRVNATVATAQSAVLDLNGDGFADMAMITGPTGRPASDSTVSVYLGSAHGLDPRPASMLADTSESGDGAGDVNGDGYPDLVTLGHDRVARTETVRVYFGGPRGVPAAPSQSLPGPAPARTQYGSIVTGAGDLNRDGFADVVVAERCFPSRGTTMIQGSLATICGSGVVFVYFGGASGLPSTPSQTIAGRAGDGALFGAAVAGGMDIDGDGYADLIVATGEGRGAFLYLGSPTGLPPVASARFVPSDPADRVGSVVAGLGDVNGDGRGDFVISEHRHGRGDLLRVYLGATTGATPVAFGIPFVGFYQEFFQPVAGAGDVDGDGLADMIVGIASPSTGEVHLHLHDASGVAIPPSRVIPTPPRPPRFGRFGATLAGLGDVNGDTFDDIAITWTDVPGPSEVHIVYGGRRGYGSSTTELVGTPLAAFGEWITGTP